MESLSTAGSVIPFAHQSSTPWLARMQGSELLNIEGTAAQRWLWVQRGSLWVTAAHGTPGPVAREADIWLSAGDRLELPPHTAWLLQAWPTADLVLLERAAPQQAWARPAGVERRPLPALRRAAQLAVRTVSAWVSRTLQGTPGGVQRA